MASVREATFELFRAHGMTTIFGNPGSTELPMLADFPEDFTYVLGLQELVVVGMADGYAQATGRPTHVNLHTAPGVGNAVGGIFNAQANKSPLVITAGQQVRPQITIEANLTNRDATVGPQPYVKWSHEPPRAAGRARRAGAGDPPRHRCRRAGRRSCRSRWTTGTRRPTRTARRARDEPARSAAATAPDPEALTALAARLAARRARCSSPAPTSTPPAAGTPRSRWPRSSACRCGRARPPAARGSASPRATPTSSACCRRPIGPISRDARRPTTWCWSSAPRCSPTTRTCPARCWPRAPRWSRSPAIPARPRGRRWATRSSATSALALEQLVELVPAGRARAARAPARARRPAGGRPAERLGGDGRARRRLAARTGSPWSRRRRARWRCATGCGSRGPGSYYFCASGGLGFGISAAVGVQLAQPGPARWCACSARARPSTGSPRCGARSPTRCRSRSSSCATTST